MKGIRDFMKTVSLGSLYVKQCVSATNSAVAVDGPALLTGLYPPCGSADSAYSDPSQDQHMTGSERALYRNFHNFT